MGTQHTPAPWKVDDFLCRTDEYGLIITDVSSSEFTSEEDIANAKRIVECVNACEGQDIETVKLATAHRNDCLQLEKTNELLIDRNDRLRDALAGMVEAFDGMKVTQLTSVQIDAWNDANEALTELRLAQEGGGNV